MDTALHKIRRVVGERGLVSDPKRGEALLVDERGLYRGRAALIVQPASTDEVAEVVRICAGAGIGMVPQGGNTGYCGGATPDESGTQVLINMARMNRVREVDPINFTATVEAGVILADLHGAVLEHDLHFPLSMGSEGSCHVGGNLSTNAGGVAVLRFGTARDLVLGLEVVLPDGNVLNDLAGLRKNNTGYDLRDLFIGAEGTLGIITAAVVKLFPAPRDLHTALVAVDSVRSACNLLGAARAESGDSLTSFEYICGDTLDLVLRNIPGCTRPLDESHEHYVLLELGSPASPGTLAGAMERILENGMTQGVILDGVIAQSGAQRAALWRLRESIPEAEKHEGGSIKHDVSLAVSRIPEFMQRAPGAVADASPEGRISAYGHIGDGNVHFNVLPPAGSRDEQFRQCRGPAVSRAVHQLVVGMNGSFSAEHGIGRLKRADLETYKDPTALRLMKSLKAALDPHNLMNPGKIL